MKLTKIVPHSLCYCLVQMMLTLTIQKVICFMRSPTLIVDLSVYTKGLLFRRISLWLRVPGYSQSFLQCIWIYVEVLINLWRIISISVFGWFCMLPSSLTSTMCWMCCTEPVDYFWYNDHFYYVNPINPSAWEIIPFSGISFIMFLQTLEVFKIISLVFSNCDFGTLMNLNADIWYAVYLMVFPKGIAASRLRITVCLLKT